MIAMNSIYEQATPWIQIRAEWHADQSCWIATNTLTGEDIAQAGTLAEIELLVYLWVSKSDESMLHDMPLYSQGRFLLH